MEKDGAWVNPLTEKLGENHQVSPRMKAIFDDIKDQYQTALAELPDLGSHFIATGERKPAISKFGDMYHVTLGHTLAQERASPTCENLPRQRHLRRRPLT